MIHVTQAERWRKLSGTGSYTPQGFEQEGFIHACSPEQLSGVLERYYKDQKDLLLLHIDPEKVKAPIKYEMSPSVQEEFPHIYGPLNTDAVIKVEEIA